jgi:hypothetical protein
MKITAEIDVTFDRLALNESDETCRARLLDHEELREEIAIAISGCEGIENLAGVEVRIVSIRPEYLPAERITPLLSLHP